MFTRTLAVSGTRLGEVRQPPSSAQCLRAASTAGAMLAGYFPHLRGAFKFPQHLAGDGELSVQPKYPQIASLISTQDVPERETSQTSKTDETFDIETVRTSVVATLMAREYGPRLKWLENKCLELRASNHQLQSDSDCVQTRFDKTRELNRRLCHEVNEARTARTAALEELDRLRDQLQERSQVAERMRGENASLREALEASEKRVLELSSWNAELKEAMQRDDTGPDAMLVVPASHEQHAADNLDALCKCNSSLSWGCPSHRVYSERLLLAHRTVSQRIGLGPPGLELESPPGLAKPEFPPGLASWDNRISLRPRLDM